MEITLANLPTKTSQEVFDYVVDKLLKQNKKSFEKGSTYICAYRGANDTKCAAGWLISDEEYKPEFEGKTWVGLVTKNVAPDTHKNLIRLLQNVHDGIEPEHWEGGFKTIAKSEGLEYKGQTI